MEIKIENVDCLNYLKELPDNSIDLIITSPPYNLKNKGGDIKVNSYFDNLPNDYYENLQIEVLNECYRVLKPLGAFFYNHKNRYENNTVITPYSWILKSKFKLHQEIIWDRLTCVDFNKAKFAPVEEKIFWLFKDKTFTLKQQAVSFTNIWRIKRPNQKQNLGHKATFPPELIYRIINSLDYDFSNSICIDIYAGTGTTAQVCKDFNFKQVILCEINQAWNDIIIQKIEQPYQKEELPLIKKTYNSKKKDEDK